MSGQGLGDECAGLGMRRHTCQAGEEEPGAKSWTHQDGHKEVDALGWVQGDRHIGMGTMRRIHRVWGNEMDVLGQGLGGGSAGLRTRR